MAVSAADVRSALQLPEPGPSNPQRKSSTPAATTNGATSTARRPEGISRELYSLIGPSQPFLAAQLNKPKLKQKPKFSSADASTSATKWELRPFKNAARKDGLELRHWVKASEDPEAEYPFAKYNIENPHYVFSQEEYSRYLEEKPWTKELTDYLFELYREYDGRWYVIWDRAEFPPECNFDIDDLKDRYYGVCRKLIRNRPWPHDEASKAQLLSSLNFDKEREKMRKKYVISLESRTPEQLAEEEALYVEIRRLEQTERRFKREREELLRTLAGMDSGLPDLVEDDGTLLGVTPDVRPSKKRKGVDRDSPAPGVSSVSSPVKRLASTRDAAYDAQHCIIRTGDGSGTTKAAHTPAFIRSAKIPWLKNNSLQPKIIQAFTEMGLSPSRLVMPTKENVAQLEALIEAVTAMVETKRHLDKVEYDIQVVKQQLEAQSEGGEGTIKTDGDAMDIEEETDGNDGRAQSVMSARSVGRHKKKSHRSMSISSVDTAATNASTRALPKRQKRG
ncbi:SWR1-complex protein 4 [Coprinopsis cinerea okayama7|uniref:SWR1-complex protein 4 n=1 Tax=Coprinopsis cinerea (strain Okayama-7 / 130 / ATCC MYA-4618 / FGSC 9003) TaxID=240176 RepID=A8NYM2_COPC7|nr:SWR1-complex protein 4 [Coprinopsis cinerea okayama7\|eukprot:XP_001837466.2 SWR1-complex protein 4 [Coprinopsis cinerea okayama7\